MRECNDSLPRKAPVEVERVRLGRGQCSHRPTAPPRGACVALPPLAVGRSCRLVDRLSETIRHRRQYATKHKWSASRRATFLGDEIGGGHGDPDVVRVLAAGGDDRDVERRPVPLEPAVRAARHLALHRQAEAIVVPGRQRLRILRLDRRPADVLEAQPRGRLRSRARGRGWRDGDRRRDGTCRRGRASAAREHEQQDGSKARVHPAHDTATRCRSAPACPRPGSASQYENHTQGQVT